MHRFLLLILAVNCRVATADCWDDAGARQGIDPLLLQAIAWKESHGNPGAIGPALADGHRALGIMQINTVHLPALAAFGIARHDLFEACTNQGVGAWILARCIQEFGRIWKAVGCYYAGPRSNKLAAQAAYVRDVQRYYARLRQQPRGDTLSSHALVQAER